jgi:hypothetical protein
VPTDPRLRSVDCPRRPVRGEHKADQRDLE